MQKPEQESDLRSRENQRQHHCLADRAPSISAQEMRTGDQVCGPEEEGVLERHLVKADLRPNTEFQR